MTRSRSRADAEDAVQDTFISAYRYLESFNSRWRFSTWIYRIAIRNLARAASPDTKAAVDVADPTADPLRECIDASDRQNLWLTARDVLSGEVYTAMWLRYAEDMSIREVADTLDRSTSWTKVSLLRARNRLSEELDAGVAQTNKGEAYG